jgi:pyrroloquinoline quinone (PQQ) biosynthesis protein C
MSIAEHSYLLSPVCRVQSMDTRVQLATRDEEILLDSPLAPQLAAVIEALRRPACPATLLAQQGIHGSQLLEPVLQALCEADLLLDLERANLADTHEALGTALQAETRFWAKPIFAQPFWEQVLSGACSPAQILGWGVEFYHFVDAANDYMPLGVAHTRERRQMRQPIASHYIEEMNHGSIFLDGLARCQLDPASIQAAPPLPHTRALINQLVEYAYEGELAYTTSFAIMQPGLATTSLAVLDEFYGRLRACYPYAAGMFDAFQRHAGLDVALGHESTVFMRLCEQAPLLSITQRQRVRTVMRSVAESFMLFFEGIGSYYGRAEGFAPRRSLQLEGLL